MKIEISQFRQEIGELQKILKERQNILKEINNRLDKYYNQDINLSNMKAKIRTLRVKCEETKKKTNDQNAYKEQIISEINDLKKLFMEGVVKFQERAEYKNNLLQNHIDKLARNQLERVIF